jgi:YVTN family beta-propeller protein
VYRQRRINTGLVVLNVILLVILVAVSVTDDDGADRIATQTTSQDTEPSQPVGSVGDSPNGDGPNIASTTTPTTEPAPTTSAPATTLAPDDGLSSSERVLTEAFTVTGDELQPKSVVATGDGLFFAQNMMYRHNVSVYDRTGAIVATIPDRVDLSEWGFDGGTVEGAPVEAAVTPDGEHVYVSNYKMYGDGWNPVADDNCDRGDWDDSFVYKINTTTFEIESVIPTGAVPKYLEVSPDGQRLVVTNWCGFDVSIIDTATDTELTRVDAGRHPRGIAITDDSRYAYVTVMGESKIVVIDLETNAIVNTLDGGSTPRHLQLSPDGAFLYVSNNLQNLVRKIDLATGGTVGTVTTGNGTRTIALTDDGDSLFVVNYHDGTVSKIRTSDMSLLQTEYSGYHPVGLTYDPDTRQVWVANYGGSLRVFQDR